jgi:hypothetical protein
MPLSGVEPPEIPRPKRGAYASSATGAIETLYELGATRTHSPDIKSVVLRH